MTLFMILELATIVPKKEESICILVVLIKVPTFTMMDPAQVIDNMPPDLSHSGLPQDLGGVNSILTI